MREELLLTVLLVPSMRNAVLRTLKKLILKKKSSISIFISFNPLHLQQGDSAEVKIAKVAITNVMLWAVTWTPYASVVMMGAFGPRENTPLSPMMSQMPAFLAKMASCFNPMIFAMAHPK